jgi:hypothetical protein
MPTQEKLVACPDCGTTGIFATKLAQHQKGKNCAQRREERAAKLAGARTLSIDTLEVLPPVKRPAKKGAPMPIAEIEDHLRRLDSKITEHTREYQNTVIYDIVGKGLLLLKAREIHLASAGRPKIVETVSTISKKDAKALAKMEAKGDQGFIAWLEEAFPDQTTRTARNYMNAARNAGLTSDHSLDDVDTLKRAMALHEKKPTDLYRLVDKDETPAPPANEPPVNLVADFQRDFFSCLDIAITMRDDMDAPAYEATWQRMQATLEKFTGAKWVITDGENDAASHGDQHAPKSKSRKASAAKGKGACKAK